MQTFGEPEGDPGDAEQGFASDHWRRPAKLRKWIWRLEMRVRPLSVPAGDLIISSVIRTLSKAGAPGTAAQVFPFPFAMGALPYTAAQLSQAAALQYQEYDRLRSEADFRLAIVPPLVALSLLAPINGRNWLILVATLASVVLLSQVVVHTRASNDILASAVASEYVSIPVVQSLADYLQALGSKPKENGAWIGAIIAGLSRRGSFEEADVALAELARLPEPFTEKDRDTAMAYLRIHEPKSADQLDQLIKRATPHPT